MPNQKAFTLVEIIVALAIFAIVATVALGALVRIVSANKKAQTLQAAITNLNFTLDSMSREMRVGSRFHCTDNADSVVLENLPSQSCEFDEHEAIFFRSSNVSGSGNDSCKLVHAYKFEDVGDDDPNWQVFKATQVDCDDDIDASDFSPLIPANVVVQDYEIGVKYDVLDHEYPLAVIRLSGYVGVRELEQTHFDVQTAVSSRIPNE